MDLFAARSPYFLERCICLILHATVTSISLKRSSLKGSSLKGTATTADAFLGEVEVDTHAGLHDVWPSLRLMRGVPSENISNLADRLGAGIHAIIRYLLVDPRTCIVINQHVSSLSTTAPDIQQLTVTYTPPPSLPPSRRTSHGQGISISLEQWYMIFSLLSAATSSAAGRSYVWECISYLVDREQINDINFTPCRHLVLRFLQGSVPSPPSPPLHFTLLVFSSVTVLYYNFIVDDTT